MTISAAEYRNRWEMARRPDLMGDLQDAAGDANALLDQIMAGSIELNGDDGKAISEAACMLVWTILECQERTAALARDENAEHRLTVKELV